MTQPYDIASLSDVGLRRSENQDRCATWPELGLFAVADGMGGLPYGAETATAALEALQRRFTGENPRNAGDWEKLMARVNTEIVALGRRLSPNTGIGTTLSIAWFATPERVVTAHVGDSIVLRLRGRKLEALTHEHTVAERARLLRAQGHEVPEPANAEHILTSCLGLDPLEEIDAREWNVQPGDRLLICSDGITKPVEPIAIAHALLDSADAKTAVKQLVRLAIEAGAPDNATAVAIFVPKGG